MCTQKIFPFTFNILHMYVTSTSLWPACGPQAQSFRTRSRATIQKKLPLREAPPFRAESFIRLRRRPPPWPWTTAKLRRETLSARDLSCFGGFRCRADDPPKPWCSCAELLQPRWRRWVSFLGTTGLPVGLHKCDIFGVCGGHQF
jgi:hypothetical protein